MDDETRGASGDDRPLEVGDYVAMPPGGEVALVLEADGRWRVVVDLLHAGRRKGLTVPYHLQGRPWPRVLERARDVARRRREDPDESPRPYPPCVDGAGVVEVAAAVAVLAGACHHDERILGGVRAQELVALARAVLRAGEIPRPRSDPGTSGADPASGPGTGRRPENLGAQAGK